MHQCATGAFRSDFASFFFFSLAARRATHSCVILKSRNMPYTLAELNAHLSTRSFVSGYVFNLLLSVSLFFFVVCFRNLCLAPRCAIPSV
jgi:hypothetical protein